MKSNKSENIAQPVKSIKKRRRSEPALMPVSGSSSSTNSQPNTLTKNESKSDIMTRTEADILASAIIEVGGPYWERILALHGAQGTETRTLSGWQPYQLWSAITQMYCAYVESNSDPMPDWLRLAAKSMTLQPWGLREKEVIQAAYDAYGWNDEEDMRLIEALKEVGEPDWSKVLAAFVTRIPGTRRTQQEIESRAIVLHRFHTFFNESTIPDGLLCLRTKELNSFGVPWNFAWSEEEDATLLEGIKQLKGPYWAKILAIYGATGTSKRILAAKSEIDLAERAREWWIAASGPRRESINDDILSGLQYLQPKGLTSSGFPTSRGWSDDQDKVLISELEKLKAPNYNEILLRHGLHGRYSECFATKNYAQLRGRALKMHDFCIREKKPLPQGLRYAKRGTSTDHQN